MPVKRQSNNRYVFLIGLIISTYVTKVYIGAKIRIIVSFHATKAAKFIFLKKNDKKVTKMFGRFEECAYLCNRKSEMTRTLLQ